MYLKNSELEKLYQYLEQKIEHYENLLIEEIRTDNFSLQMHYRGYTNAYFDIYYFLKQLNHPITRE